MYRKRAIVWFRQDLRLHDNVALTEALKSADEIIPVYVFDERVFQGKTSFGFPKTGRYRARFIIESVQDLRTSLRRLGTELIVRTGKPEEVVFEIAQAAKTSWVFCNRERTREEVAVQDALERSLWTIGQEMRFSRGKMLYHTGDLPFPIQHTPDQFTQFRKEVERYVPVREPLGVPEQYLPTITVNLQPGVIPSLADFGHVAFDLDERAALAFRGGETEALKRLQYYIWESGLFDNHEEAEDRTAADQYATKLSPWLAQGCLSPKTVYHEIKKFEARYGADENTYRIFFELMLRDFYRFMAKKHEEKIFRLGGIPGDEDPEWKNDHALLARWIEGRTGVPFIDAAMREIGQTGYLSNLCRQSAASFLVYDLKINWQMGAEYFESILIDYDVASNWGNWNTIAGVGSDPRDNRPCNVQALARRYDPAGIYVKKWVPELADRPADQIHEAA